MGHNTCISCGNYVAEDEWACKACLSGANERIVSSAKAALEDALRSIKKAMSNLGLVVSYMVERIDNAPGFDSIREDVLAE